MCGLQDVQKEDAHKHVRADFVSTAPLPAGDTPSFWCTRKGDMSLEVFWGNLYFFLLTKPIFALADGSLQKGQTTLVGEQWVVIQGHCFRMGCGSVTLHWRRGVFSLQFPGFCYICSNYYELWDTSVTKQELHWRRVCPALGYGLWAGLVLR